MCVFICTALFECFYNNTYRVYRISNFSSEEACIREVWMEEKICLSRRGKMSGDGERTNGVVLSFHLGLPFHPDRNEWLCFCGYLHYAYMKLFGFFFL